MVHEGGWTVAYDGPSSKTIFTAADGHQVVAPTRANLTRAA
jgi:hypothetical protein